MIDPIINGLAIFAILLAFVFGWVFAHNTIADECEKLQSFYVGSHVFECKVKK
jgi:hypothetical protein